MTLFLSGAVWMGFWVASLFFARFWRTSRERLFLLFASAFFLFGVERIVLVCVDPRAESRPYIFLIRLLGFLILIWGVVDKSRARTRSRMYVMEQGASSVADRMANVHFIHRR